MSGVGESKIVYSGRVVRLRIDYLTGEGRKIREVVEHPGAVAILPLVSRDSALLIRQYRHPINEWILEIPAGTLKKRESPERCALRELEEETGYRAGILKKMLTIYTSPGYSTESIHIFIAYQLEKSAQKLEEDEQLSIVEMGIDEAIRELSDCKVADSKTLLTLLYYKHVYRELE